MQEDCELRYKMVFHQYSRMERFRLWWRGIADAIRETPDTKWSEYVAVRKGEPGYEDAPWKFITVPGPLRFTYENGEYKNVTTTTRTPDTAG